MSFGRRPLISVAMPVLNVETTVLEAVESIRQQTMTDWELLIIDDGSTDHTQEILRTIRDPRIHVVSHDENAGVGQRLNEAVQMARGEYVARMDGDDISYPDRLATQLAYLTSHPDVDIVGSWLALLDPSGEAFGTSRPPEMHAAITRLAFHSIALPHPTYFGRRDWFVKNPYLPEFLRMEDQILLMHTAARSTFANVQRPLLGYRMPAADVRSAVLRRWKSIGNAVRFFWVRKQYLHILANVSSNLAVGMVECLAEITSLRNRLLVHRVRPLTFTQKATWNEVRSRIMEHVSEGSAVTTAALPDRSEPAGSPVSEPLAHTLGLRSASDSPRLASRR